MGQPAGFGCCVNCVDVLSRLVRCTRCGLAVVPANVELEERRIGPGRKRSSFSLRSAQFRDGRIEQPRTNISLRGSVMRSEWIPHSYNDVGRNFDPGRNRVSGETVLCCVCRLHSVWITIGGRC